MGHRTRRAASATPALAIVLVASLLLAGCGLRGAGMERNQDGHYTIKFSHVVTPKTPKGQAAEKFKELVEARSRGRIAVEIYPNSELYGDEDELQALQMGTVQMLAPASAKFTTIAPQLQVLDLPFVFDSVDDIPKIASPDTMVGKAIFDNRKLAAKNIKVLGLWDNGLKQLSSNTEMRGPADLRGQSFRIQPSDVLRGQFAAWGGQSTPLAFGELYNALQQGVVNGQENPYSNIESQNMHTVQKFITESNHGYVGYVPVMNRQFFDDLPDDLKKIVTESMDESSAYNRKIAAELNDTAERTIREAGTTTVVELTPQEREAFKRAVVPKVWQDHAGLIGQDVIDELLRNNH